MKRFIVGTLLMVPVLLVVRAGASPVHVMVNEDSTPTYGAGFSVRRGQECFVITPNHVVDFMAPDGARITDATGRTGLASMVKTVVEFDAALLKMKSNDAIDCGEEWQEFADTGRLVSDAEYLTGVKQDGNRRQVKQRFFVSSLSLTHIELEPFSRRDSIERGDSGTTLYVNDTPVGMILEVHPSEGTGIAITQSQLHGLFGNDLMSEEILNIAIAPIMYRSRENPYATIAVQDLLAENDRLRVVETTLDPRTRQPLLPDDVDYVVSGKILDVSYERVKNENYKSEAKRDNSFGDKLLNSLTQKNQTERYFTDYMIDIEITIYDMEEDTSIRNLERQSLQIREQRTQDTDKTATSTAVSAALRATLLESDYSSWLRTPPPKQAENPLKSLFGGGRRGDG